MLVSLLESQRGSGPLSTWQRCKVFMVHFTVRSAVEAKRGYSLRNRNTTMTE